MPLWNGCHVYNPFFSTAAEDFATLLAAFVKNNDRWSRCSEKKDNLLPKAMSCANFPRPLHPATSYCDDDTPCPQGWKKVNGSTVVTDAAGNQTRVCCEEIHPDTDLVNRVKCCLGVVPLGQCPLGLCPISSLCPWIVQQFCQQNRNQDPDLGDGVTADDLCKCNNPPAEVPQNSILRNFPSYCYDPGCRQSIFFRLYRQFLPDCSLSIFECEQIVNIFSVNSLIEDSQLAVNCPIDDFTLTGELKPDVETARNRDGLASLGFLSGLALDSELVQQVDFLALSLGLDASTLWVGFSLLILGLIGMFVGAFFMNWTRRRE